MALIAGLALGIWLVVAVFQGRQGNALQSLILYTLAFLLGGISLIGPPLLLAERLRRRGRWGPGRLIWFAQGMASWLLWPPVIYIRARERNLDSSESASCYAYGTPLMAIYVTTALLAGGWLGRSRRRRARRSWRERFGLMLGLAWACTGAYALYLLYEADFFNRR